MNTTQENREPYDFEDQQPEDVLRSYTAYKIWRKRTTNKINTLLDLQQQAFSQLTFNALTKGISDLEEYADMLVTLADWLVLNEVDKADAHVKEAKAWVKEADDLIVRVHQLCHEQSIGGRGAAIAAAAGQGGAGAGGSKPLNELKPDRLCHDANMAQFRTWKDEFSAYHSASNMRNLTLPCQHAFLLKCLDVSISMRVKRLKTDTTPIFPIPGTNSCFDIVSEFFREKNPMMIRRRAFFNYRQAEGQDLSTFRETLRQMADDADIAMISLEEILCLMYAVGVRDDKLREKFYEVPDPSIHQFHVIMDAWAQKNRQMSDHDKKPATAMKVGDKGAKKKEPNQRKPPLSEEEKSRQRSIKGRCFRCGLQDHMMPACKLSPNITCNSCKNPGHITAACGNSGARLVQSDSNQLSHIPNALDYFPAATSSYVGASYSASGHNRPTPQLPL